DPKRLGKKSIIAGVRPLRSHKWNPRHTSAEIETSPDDDAEETPRNQAERRAQTGKRRHEPAPRIESPLLSVKEGCVFFACGVTTFYTEILPRVARVKIGGRTYITRKSAEAYIEANTRPPVRPIVRKHKLEGKRR